MSNSHRISGQVDITPEVLGKVLAPNYGYQPLCEITWDPVDANEDPDDATMGLILDVGETGILDSIVIRVQQRGYVLTDGHRRAISALAAEVSCPAYLVFCDCPTEGVCAVAEEQAALLVSLKTEREIAPFDGMGYVSETNTVNGMSAEDLKDPSKVGLKCAVDSAAVQEV